jgi:hypothetical protein
LATEIRLKLQKFLLDIGDMSSRVVIHLGRCNATVRVIMALISSTFTHVADRQNQFWTFSIIDQIWATVAQNIAHHALDVFWKG